MEVTTQVSDKKTNPLRDAIIASIGTAIVAGCISWAGFYYNTRSSIVDLTKSDAAQTEQIGKLAMSVSELTAYVSELNTKTAVISTAPDNLNKQIQDLNQRMARVENQQDKMYEILIDLSKRK